MKIAQIQLTTYEKLQDTMEELKHYFEIVCKENIDMVFVGEMFACPYHVDLFKKYAEPQGGELFQFCSDLAKKYKVYFSAGTMPELEQDGKLYNTAYVFDRQGDLLAKYRKMHLFDVNIPGRQVFRESDILTPGTEIVTFDTEFGKMGICICFDIRFPEQVMQMVARGAVLIVCPAAFNTTTGPMHWELLFRARAVDNQCFCIATSTALDEGFSYHSYGHSIAVSPWGNIISQLSTEEDIVISEIDFSEVHNMRSSIPLKR